MSNILERVDQTLFAFERATGATSLGQCVWVYNRGIDIDGLRQFHHHLAHGRLSRRIERSPLPFGRHRWVRTTETSQLEIVKTPSPRAEFDSWLAQQAEKAIDAEHGPGWHLAVLPFTDGGAGVSLVASHCLADGVAGAFAVAEAACGYGKTFNWPSATSRRRWQALREDARQVVRDIPQIGSAAAAATRFARGNRNSAEAARPLTRMPARRAGSEDLVAIPSATAFIDADHWDARVAALRGSSSALLGGVAAQLAKRVGRVAADSTVTLALPVNERTAEDTRANAVTNVNVTIDPANAWTDLRGIRTAINQALSQRHRSPDQRLALLPIVPLLPRRLIRRWVSVAAGGATTVGVSNIGVISPLISRPDGTDADYTTARSLYAGMRMATLKRAGGMLALLSARLPKHTFVSVLGYQPGRLTSDEELRAMLSETLDDFSLTAVIGWPPPDSETTDAVEPLRLPRQDTSLLPRQ